MGLSDIFPSSPHSLDYFSSIKKLHLHVTFQEILLKTIGIRSVLKEQMPKWNFGAGICVGWLVMRTPSLVLGAVLTAPGMWQPCNC